MSIYEYWIQQKLNRILRLGFLRVTVSFQGEWWEVTAMTRGDITSLAQGHSLRQTLREGYVAGVAYIAESAG